jgi:hypothetical protein
MLAYIKLAGQYYELVLGPIQQRSGYNERPINYFSSTIHNREIAPLHQGLKKCDTECNDTRGLYYETLRTRNLRENARFQNKLVTLARTNTLLLEQTNTLAY